MVEKRDSICVTQTQTQTHKVRKKVLRKMGMSYAVVTGTKDKSSLNPFNHC